MLHSDDEEEDTFVTIGTCLEPVDEDEPRKKKVHVEDLPVKDSEGRVRFHGAFTGGFSAGYFNSVGSKDGWTPSTFTSSRSQKAEKRQSAYPEDFMDAEDMGEHGIAPRSLTTKDDFSTVEKNRKRLIPGKSSIIPGEAALVDLIVPDVPSVGVRLLTKMGWKMGQGIGPRVKNKLKKKQKSKMEKVYGCALPQSSGSDSEVSDTEAEFLSGVTFAPLDTSPVSFVSKDNYHGIGYRGLNPRVDTGIPRGHTNPTSRSGKQGMTGHAFGIGALEDEDDDIYSMDHMSDYHQTLGGDDEMNTLSWSAPRQRQSRFQQNVAHLGKILEGFEIASKPLGQQKVFPPPKIPASYTQHSSRRVNRENRFVVDQPKQQQHRQEKRTLDSATRGLMLGELPPILSVPASPETTSQENNMPSRQENNNPTQTTGLSSPAMSHQTKPDLGNLYKPFARDPPKQQRYEKYLAQLGHGSEDPFSGVFSDPMTEWERDQEREEFSRSSKLYRPLSVMMASRFTTAKYDDADPVEEVTEQTEGKKSDQLTAVEMKMFGKLTRESFDWHPDNVLCKRFNIPHPYPGSTTVGLPKAKRNTFSVFDIMSYDNKTEVPTATTSTVVNSEATKPKAVNPKSVSFKVPTGKGRLTTANIFAAYFEEEDRKKNNAKMSEKIESTDVVKETMAETESNHPPEVREVREVDIQGDTGRPPMDLFKAIFQDSDESDSDQEEPDIDQSQTIEIHQSQDTRVDQSKTIDNSQSQGTSIDQSHAMNIDQSYTRVAEIKAEHTPIDLVGAVSLAGRSSPTESDSGMFGPILPPENNSIISPSTQPDLSTRTEYQSGSQPKHKHKHSDKDKKKNKHKKEKKAKHKKRKHHKDKK